MKRRYSARLLDLEKFLMNFQFNLFRVSNVDQRGKSTCPMSYSKLVMTEQGFKFCDFQLHTPSVTWDLNIFVQQGFPL